MIPTASDAATTAAGSVVPGHPGALLTPAEVAALFRVDPKTVTRWANAGKLSAVRTLGGHRRFYEGEVRSLLGIVPAQNQSGE